jgi:hypothetical protein
VELRRIQEAELLVAVRCGDWFIWNTATSGTANTGGGGGGAGTDRLYWNAGSGGSRRLRNRNYQIHNLTMDTKIYRLYGIDTAMHLLRPGAKWEISNSVITKWDDPRPQPSMEEVREVMDKIQAFEDSINTVWLPEQIEELTGRK